MTQTLGAQFIPDPTPKVSRVPTPSVDFGPLAAAVMGEVLLPPSARYEEVRGVWNAAADLYPAAIVRPLNAREVACAVRFARASSLPLAVRSGGHSPAGFGTVEGGLVLDLSAMKAISADPQTRRVWVQPGLTWGEVADSLQSYGLAITAGDTPTVGVGGLTQGGGIGWFVRKHGLALDRLRAVELVTAEGQLLRASAGENPELFWGIRGGGANFGVITQYEFEAHEGGTVLGGLVIFSGVDARRILGEYARLAAAADDGLSTQAVLFAAPPLPFVPEEAVGQPLVAISMCYSGDLTQGEAVLAPLRRLGTPVLDTVAPIPYSGMLRLPLYAQAGDRGFRHFIRSQFVTQVDGTFLDALVDGTMQVFNPGTLVQLRVLGGELARIPAESAAFSHRDKAAVLMIAHLVPGEHPAEAAELAQQATEHVWQAVRPFACGTYGNFLALGEEGRVGEVFRTSALQRLAVLKAQYDPHNVFARNANVRA
ncbi:FAD-binding oxidoreductase [Deinococcus hopiensis]|uniref:FAD/FMN-containing dehydrogenase n=1 Tax=Deinococcus hopiensis KR-140 TaxID=695939 RepID=A0A1W1UNN9_9DEIO|nr:FAD-dependent oxidoreductase [Deinococcus hopiensis]SMB82748.1 FAD/FMN-containing dehydrogenase [Deinococcus hopiensis KR-140]